MKKEKQVIEEVAAPGPLDLAPPDYLDPVIEAYKKDVDRSLLREKLKLSVEERIRKAQNFHKTVEECAQPASAIAWPQPRRKRLDRGPGTSC